MSAAPASDTARKPLNRVREARRAEGISLRSASNALGLPQAVVCLLEDPYRDLSLSELYAWELALRVPAAELLLLPDRAVVAPSPLQDRSALLRIMKTARSLQEHAATPKLVRLAENLVNQLLVLMPELEEIAPWHSVGTRRTSAESGRTETNPVKVPANMRDWALSVSHTSSHPRGKGTDV